MEGSALAELGELEEVDLRTVWPDEEDEFTPWLADHLDYLSDILEMDLELRNTEEPVGSYSADIAAQPIQEDLGVVIIENQLSSSDHDHLGKIITYGAGLSASYVVWICEEVKEEHRTAIDWLNDNFPKDVGFLALEINVWRIGDSELAPKFEVICKPDEWKSYIKSAPELTETKRMQKKFWDELKDYMSAKDTNLSLRKTHPQHWYNISIGKSGFHIGLTVNTREKRVGCELHISKGGTKAIKSLMRKKEEIEEELGADLNWKILEDRKASRIVQFKDFDLKHDDWTEIFPWLKEKAESFHKVFSPRIKEIEI